MAKPLEFSSIRAAQGPKLGTLEADYRRLASTGLKTAGGQISQDYGDPKLRGRTAQRIYQEMCDDASAGVLVYLIYNMLRGVKWDVRARSEATDHKQHAEFVQTCMDDMDKPWGVFVQEALSMAPFGFAPFDTVMKKRLGRKPPKDPNGDDQAPSNYNDQRIGWATFTLIGQDTITRWEFDPYNRVTGLYQQAAPTYAETYIPESRLLNFRNNPFRDSPEGESMFRRAFRSWAKKRHLENVEGIGLERRLCGLPVIRAPSAVIADDASDGNKAITMNLQNIGANVRNDEQAFIMMPSDMSPDGKSPLFTFELLSGGDSSNTNIGPVIERYNTEIFRSSLADFLGLGQGTSSQGSFAMHQDKSALFLMGMRAYLRNICDLFNRVAIPRLFELNGIQADGYPEIDHSPLDQTDAQSVCQSLLAMAQAGFMVAPNEEIQRRIFEMLGLPASVQDDGMDQSLTMQVGAQQAGEKPQEVFQNDAKDEQGTVQERPPLRDAPRRVDRDAAAITQRARPNARIG